MPGIRTWSLVVPLTLALAAGAPSQAVPPPVAGVVLGLTADGVRRVLGLPDRQEQSLGMRFWNYQRRGVTLIWKEGDAGVQGIVASRLAAGDVGGVKVGDSEALVRSQWGTPVRVRQDGRFLDFTGASWVLSAELKEKKVVQITLMAAGAAGS